MESANVSSEFRAERIWHQKSHKVYNIKGKQKKIMKVHFSFSHSYQRDINLKIRVPQRTNQRWSLHLRYVFRRKTLLFTDLAYKRTWGSGLLKLTSECLFLTSNTVLMRSLEDSNVKTFQHFTMFAFTFVGLQKSPQVRKKRQIILSETSRSQTPRRLMSRSCLSVLASGFPTSSLSNEISWLISDTCIYFRR